MSPWLRPAVALLGVLAAGAPLATAAAPSERASVERCQVEVRHGQHAQAEACYTALARQRSSYLQAEGLWGLKQYEEANDAFRAAVDQSPDNALYKVRWGLLLHERFNDQDAQGLFKEVLARDPRDAQAMLGLAKVAADGFDSGAEQWARKALAADPQLAEAHELLAELALEDSDPQQAAKEADLALAISPESLDAMAIHASIELLADRPPDAWFARIRAINPTYGQGYEIAARQLILVARYIDGVQYYRKALALDPTLWSASSELGVNLMRLGENTEARQALTAAYEHGYRDASTVNTLRLLDSYKNFVLKRDGQAILKLNKKEADLLYPYFMEQLKRAIADYSRKYQMTLAQPVQVEVYPDHEDFAVRALGMPGLGALGVTFGYVVAMDSPTGRKPGDFHWASTLRHEMSHVFILAATRHRVARWFTEGLAVHEETQASPEWGDPLTPDAIIAMRQKKLLPVASLDRGFVHPQYETQVVVSYFQAGQICDYIGSRWGEGKLLDMVHAYAHQIGTHALFEQTLGMSPEQFDPQFDAWVYARYQVPVDNFETWRKQASALVKAADQKDYDTVIRDGAAVIALYPQYVYDSNAYQLLAQAQLARGDKAGAAQTLEGYMHQGGRNPATLSELGQLQQDLGDPQAAAATLNRINYIDPAYDPDVHRRLGELWLAQKNYPGAIREFAAVVAMHPLDVAGAELDLAQAYFQSGARAQAQDAVLASLEAAPNYRPAQKLLLELTAPDSK